MSNRRKFAILGLIAVLAIVGVVSVSAKSTTKTLSTNFTLVNLANGANAGSIQYYKSDGTPWRASDTFGFSALGDQKVVRQYTDPDLPQGEGSVVVGASGPVGAVVQIRALNQTPTSGAYSGATGGAAQVYIPLVSRRGTSAQGTANSQIIVQNTGSAATNFAVDLIDRNTGATTLSKTFSNLAAGASVTYDLDDEAGLPTNWFGSAVVRTTTTGGQVTAVSNFFLGANAMQTYNGFSTPATKWIVPLFTSRLPNGLSTPITVQNLSGNPIAAGGITATCVPVAASSVQQNITLTPNAAAVGNNAGFSWNPVTDTSIPAGFQGSCTITTAANTVAFVQMRFIGTDNAAAYEALNGTTTDTTVVIPLYLKRLQNGFATAVTIANLGSAPANVTLTYKRNADAPANLTCDATLTASIPAGGSLVQNHRIASGTGSVPQINDNCQGSITVTQSANPQPLGAFVQITTINNQPGDTFMAHDAFGIK